MGAPYPEQDTLTYAARQQAAKLCYLSHRER